MYDKQALIELLSFGEGQKQEFKQSVSKNIDREIVAFANASGGTIFIGVDDNANPIGTKIDNKLLSQIQSIAHECDPSIRIECQKFPNQVLGIHVSEGNDKPYRCKDGFFLRIGANTQKLKRDEIVEFLQNVGKIRFDEAFNNAFNYPSDFSMQRYHDYLSHTNIKTNNSPENVLQNLGIAKKEKNTLQLNNAGILFFANEPQHFINESYITCVRYQTNDRLNIIDKQDIKGSLIEMIEQTMQFIKRHISVALIVGNQTHHKEVYDYPLVAIREALVNAVMHRDYYYDVSHIYIHIFNNRMEIENPGGLLRGMTLDDLGTRSVRRNACIADLLLRAQYVERVGSGIPRIRHSLELNTNPPFEVNANNYFVIRFYPRIQTTEDVNLTERQIQLLHYIQQHRTVTKKDCEDYMQLSGDTVLREINKLIEIGLMKREGIGKGTRYILRSPR